METDPSLQMPYGSWPSPISAQALVEGVVGLSGLKSDGEHLLWLEGRPEEAGRTVLEETAFDLHELLDDLADMFNGGRTDILTGAAGST